MITLDDLLVIDRPMIRHDLDDSPDACVREIKKPKAIERTASETLEFFQAVVEDYQRKIVEEKQKEKPDEKLIEMMQRELSFRQSEIETRWKPAVEKEEKKKAEEQQFAVNRSKYLTINELSDMFSMMPTKIRNLIYRNRIQHKMVVENNALAYDPEDFRRYVYPEIGRALDILKDTSLIKEVLELYPEVREQLRRLLND